VLDGGALSAAHGTTGLAQAVIVHTLPVGLVAWRYASASHGPRAATALLVGLGLSTIAGFALGQAAWQPGVAGGLINAALSGSLLHALAHRPHVPVAPSPESRRASGLAAIAGVAVVLGTSAHPPVGAEAFAELVLEASPSLLLGLLAAGALHAWVPTDLLARLAGTGRLRQSLTGALAGLPVPVCSCGVLPAYEGLVRRGLPGPAAVGFLIAGPEVGIPALLLSASLLGGAFTSARLAAALGVAVGVAWWLGRGAVSAAPPAPAVPVDGRLREALRYGLVETVDHTAPWVLLGLALAAGLDPLLQPDALAILPAFAAVPLMALLGVPAYVCASGATPLAAVLAAKGVSGGAVLAFLLTGPATNLTTFGVLSRLHGRAFSLRFGAGVAAGAVLAGWAVDAAGLQVLPTTSSALHEHHGVIAWVSAAALLALTVASLVRTGLDAFLDVLLDPLGQDPHDGHAHDDDCGCGHIHTPPIVALDGPLTIIGPVTVVPSPLRPPSA
jgi:uncharacterized membrane protein YraQ (UPF0718 family)